MYGDTATIRRLADRVSEQAADIRADADHLVQASGSVVWDGQAARALRERMARRAGALRRTADEHEDAAEALRRHAAAVDRVADLIADVAARIRSVLPDLPDDVLARFDPPPDGHRDWLDAAERMTGLSR